MSQQQSYFTGLHYNKSNYESNEETIQASDVIETTSKKFLTNSSQTIDGIKTFTNGIELSSIKCNNIEKINLSNDVTIYGTKVNLASDTNKYLEIGTNTANVCYLDFHSSNTSNSADYHSRIISSAGTTVGTGSLALQASTISLNTNTSVSGTGNQLKVGSTTVQGVSLNGNGNSYIDFYGMNNSNSAFDGRIECVGGNATTAGTGELHFWSNGVNIAAHDGTKGLRLGGVVVTPTAYDLNTIAKASSVEYVTGSTHTWNGARLIMVNTTTGSGCTITMPSVTGLGNREVTIFNYGSQNVVINRSGTNVFNGNQTSITLSNNNENVTLLEVTTAAFVGFIQTSFNSTVRTLNGV